VANYKNSTTYKEQRTIKRIYVKENNNNNNFHNKGRDCSVGVATRYGLDGPEIECR